MNILVVGGTSGLGLELAKGYADEGKKVIITGRRDPKIKKLEFKELDLSREDLVEQVEKLVKGLPAVNTLVYAAGFYQSGTVTDLNEKQIEEMIDVGGRALIYFVRAILKKQGTLDEIITITSTSQWTPRKLEPIYNFVKAAAGHFTNSLAEDGRIKKSMVVGPSGMKTGFWRSINHPEWNDFLDPTWVAKQIMVARDEDYCYKYIRILRQPARIEVIETRK